MKKILLSSFIAASLLTGCSAVYQSGQTPDDLYYATGKDNTKSEVRNDRDEERYQEYVRTADDRYLRMKVSNRNQWSSIDNFSYWNDMRYSFPSSYGTYSGYNYGFNHPGFSVIGNPWNIGWSNSWGIGNGMNAWNTWGYGGGVYGNRLGWNNPCYTLIAYTAPKLIPATYTSGSNLGAYKNRTYNTINSNGNDKWGTPSTSGTSGGNNNFGNLVRKVFSAPSSNGSSNGSYDRPARTFSNSSNGSGTSSSAGGSSGGFKSTGSSASTGRGGRGN